MADLASVRRSRLDAFDGESDEDAGVLFGLGIAQLCAYEVLADDPAVSVSVDARPALAVFRFPEATLSGGPVCSVSMGEEIGRGLCARVFDAAVVDGACTEEVREAAASGRLVLRVHDQRFAGQLEGWRLVRDRVPAAATILRPLAVSDNACATLMPRLETDLFSLVWESHRLTADFVDRASPLVVLVDMIDGVIHLHTHGVAHRDIKPENVMVNKDGRGVLVDFDFACGRPEIPLACFAGTLRYAPGHLARDYERKRRLRAASGQAPVDDGAVYDCFEVDIHAACITIIEVLLHDPAWATSKFYIRTKDKMRGLFTIARRYSYPLAESLRRALVRPRASSLVSVREALLEWASHVAPFVCS
jgi:hypothetical protein